MKLFLIISFCSIGAVSSAQNRIYAKLQLIYPEQLSYDTLLVKDSESKMVSETSTLKRKGKTIQTYLINAGSLTDGSFSIYFGGSLSAVNDTLYFSSKGKDLLIELKDSFALRDHINFKLQNVSNFEDLYQRYIQYCRFQMEKYDSLVKASPDYKMVDLLLKAGMDFVKMNITNPYSIDLFAVFVISPTSHATYNEANQFYVGNLKDRIKNPKTRMYVEHKMEILKHSVEEGNKIPFFSARSIHNQLVNSDSLRGKNVLLNFWATWCVPCIQEVPSLKEIHEEYKGDNLVMVSVSLDRARDSLKMANTVTEKKMDWVHIFNNPAMLESFQINPIPHTFLIDENGVIIYNSIYREKGVPDPRILKSFLKEKFKH